MNRDDGDVILVGPDGKPLAIGPTGIPVPDLMAMTRRANTLRKDSETNTMEVIRLYRTAAEGGFAPAQNNLGVMYEKGIGVNQSNQQAAYWFQRAAIQGEPLAQHSLGIMYLEARGVEHDPTRGALWLKRSAIQGHPGAGADLAHLYWKGEGLMRDKVRGLAWWLIAARSGDKNSARFVAEARQTMSPEEIAAAEAMAKETVAGF